MLFPWFPQSVAAPLFAGIVALSWSGSAHAQSIYGAGGLFLNPTADFLKQGEITPAALELQERQADSSDQLTWTSYGVNYGLNDRVELGATYLKVNGNSPRFKDGSFGLVAKYKVLEEKRGSRPALAIGANFLSGGDSNARTAFGVLRYTATRPAARHPLRLHLGAMYIDQLEGIKYRELAPYAGTDLGVTRNLTAFAEVRSGLKAGTQGELGTHVPRAVGVVWKPVKNYKLVVVYGSNGWSGKHSQLGFGVGYSIRGGR